MSFLNMEKGLIIANKDAYEIGLEAGQRIKLNQLAAGKEAKQI